MPMVRSISPSNHRPDRRTQLRSGAPISDTQQRGANLIAQVSGGSGDYAIVGAHDGSRLVSVHAAHMVTTQER